MPYDSETLAALIGSRICHDLVSPIGAVNNGIELLSLSGVSDGPEISLVADSAASANARICLLRLAFGTAAEGQISRADEIAAHWRGIHPPARLRLDWAGPATLSRREARLVVLACLCTETALPTGGTLQVTHDESGWRITGTGERVAAPAQLWNRLVSQQIDMTITPAHVQFLLLPAYLHEIGRLCHYHADDTAVTISF